MSWMNKNNGVKAPTRSTSAEAKQGGGSFFKNGDKANFNIERISVKSSDNANVKTKHGEAGAAEYINIMWRINAHESGRESKSVVFQNLYIFSQDLERASKDVQFLATICTLAEAQGIDGIYSDIIESEDKPDDQLLADLIGVKAGAVVGVMEQKGQDPSTFIRNLHEEYVFDDKGAEGAVAGSGRRRSRGK